MWDRLETTGVIFTFLVGCRVSIFITVCVIFTSCVRKVHASVSVCLPGAFSGAWGGGMLCLVPLKAPLKVMAPRPRLICGLCMPAEFKDDICIEYFQKCMRILICKCKLYHRFKQNIPESESRQFDRLRLRLRLPARCHDSGRLRFRLGHRLHTPAMGVFFKIETEHILEIWLELSVVSFPSGRSKLFFSSPPSSVP